MKVRLDCTLVGRHVLVAARELDAGAAARRSRRPQPTSRIWSCAIGTTSDLITDNPWAVSAGSDWIVVTTQYDMAAEVLVRGPVARAESGDRLRRRTPIPPNGPARCGTGCGGATARR